MTATDSTERVKAEIAAPALVVAEPRTRHTSRGRLILTPVLIAAALLTLYAWVSGLELDSIEQRTLNWDYLLAATLQHLELSTVAAALILAIAIPLGVLVSRPWAKALAPLVLGLSNVGQAFPAIGLLVLLTMEMGAGTKVALISIVAYGVLPVLRNTIVGLQQIDPGVTEAARGIGMRPHEVLLRVELPLAVPVMLAGVRTTLVLAIGVATLATFVAAGGLGDIIVNGLKLNRFPVQVTGAVLVMCIAFLVDWLARIAEDLLRPEGL